MKILADFLCDDGHLTEQFVNSEVRTSACRVCGKDAQKAVSAPQIKLEGITGAFPGAYDKWERVRAEKLKQEQKRNAE